MIILDFIDHKMKPESYQEVYLPIAPQVEQGMITIRIQTYTQIRRQVFEIDLEIMVRKSPE